MSSGKWSDIKLSVREEQVENAVKFLQSDEVKNITFEEKLKFLKSKGLTETEISRSLQRYEYEENQTSQRITQTFLDKDRANQSNSGLTRFILPISLGLSTIMSAMYLLQTLHLPQTKTFFKSKLFNKPEPLSKPDADKGNNSADVKALEDSATPNIVPYNEESAYGWSNFVKSSSPVSSEVSHLLKEQTDLLRELNINLKDIKSELISLNTDQLTKLSSIEDTVNTKLLKEVKNIKVLQMIDRGNETSGDRDKVLESIKEVENILEEVDNEKSMNSIDRLLFKSRKGKVSSDSKVNVEKESKKDESEEKKELTTEDYEELIKEKNIKIEEELQKLSYQNSSKKEKLSIALSTISLYLSNILNNWESKMYGKISLSNKTYKQNLLPINNHVDFLQACGFEESNGTSRKVLEFKTEWKENKENWAEQVLKHAKGKINDLQQDLKTGQIKASPPIVETSNQPQQETEDQSKDKILQTKTSTEETVSAKQDVDVENEAVADKKTKQLNFSEITEKVKNDPNWKPPDYQEIPNTLSKDKDDLLKLPKDFKEIEQPSKTKLKPWEMNPSYVDLNKDVEISAEVEEVN